ncbi:GyrI-like domain-containing protein [Niallia sp. Krafla_26]|uniref:GyrI-like domain-containing protein n=1 Tax=Niallia sp. Krafla_26 TaxID=3064703 RepID=UPI003D185FE5
MKLYLVNSIRTNNFTDAQMTVKIKKLWEDSSRKIVLGQKNVYGVYYDYESDYKGNYSLSVAIDENNGNPFIEIPLNERYEIFRVDSADEQGIVKTWKKIWDQEASGLLERAYTYDFEKYSTNGEVEIYIAIK